MTAALTNGPIGFTDAQGKQIFIPLSVIYFDTAGAIKVDQWPPYKANKVNKTAVDAWLQYLSQSGVIVPDTAPAPKAAMLIKSKDPGTAGNSIHLAFSNITLDANNPGNSTLDATLSETNTYTGLKPSTIAGVIGTDAPTVGSQSGLVHLKGLTATALPKNGDYQLTGGTAVVAATKDIDKNSGSGAAFTVEAKRVGADGSNTKVTIKDVDTAAGTFTLIASWTKTLTGVKVSDIAAGCAYEVEISAPPGGVLAAPVAGTITLSGGADTQAATPASTVVLASQ